MSDIREPEEDQNTPAVEALEQVMHEAAVSNDRTQDIAGVAGKRLESLIQRIERLEAEKATIMEDIKEVYGEAKGVGFNVKTIREIVKLRAMDAEKRNEEASILGLYMAALGIPYSL